MGEILHIIGEEDSIGRMPGGCFRFGRGEEVAGRIVEHRQIEGGGPSASWFERKDCLQDPDICAARRSGNTCAVVLYHMPPALYGGKIVMCGPALEQLGALASVSQETVSSDTV